MKEAFSAGQFQRVIDLANTALGKDPKDVNALYWMLRTLENQRRFSEALQYSLRKLSVTLEQQQQQDELKAANEALHVANLYFITNQEEYANHWMEYARVILTKLQLERTHHFHFYWLVKARAHHKKRNLPEYLRCTEEALKLTHKGSNLYLAALLEKGNALVITKDNKAAMACYMEIMAYETSNATGTSSTHASACYSLALIYHSVGHYGMALPLFEECLVFYRQVLGPRDAFIKQLEDFVARGQRVVATAMKTVEGAAVSWDVCKSDRAQCVKCNRRFAVLNRGGKCDVCCIFFK